MQTAKLGEDTVLYRQLSASEPICELKLGQRIRFGKVTEAGGRKWVRAAALPGGDPGYIAGSVRLLEIDYGPKPDEWAYQAPKILAGLTALSYFMPWLSVFGHNVSGITLASGKPSLVGLWLFGLIWMFIGSQTQKDKKDSRNDYGKTLMGCATGCAIILLYEYIMIPELPFILSSGGAFALGAGSIVAFVCTIVTIVIGLSQLHSENA